MASLAKVYEKGKVQMILVFRGKGYNSESGLSIPTQVKKDYLNDPDIEEIFADINLLYVGSDKEIDDALASLEVYENEKEVVTCRADLENTTLSGQATILN